MKKDDVNLDDEFEKIVPFKFKKLSEESLDEVDHEIEEILHEAEPLGQEIKTDIDPHAAEPSPSPDDSVQTFEPVEVKQEASIVEEKSQPEVVKQEKLSKDQEKPIEDHKELIEKPKESIDDHKSSNSDQQKSSSDVQERTPPSDSIESKHIEASINDSEPKATLIAAETVPSAKRENSADEKPPVPAPTYLWEDLKRAKEQVSGDQPPVDPHVCTTSRSISAKNVTNPHTTRIHTGSTGKCPLKKNIPLKNIPFLLFFTGHGHGMFSCGKFSFEGYFRWGIF